MFCKVLRAFSLYTDGQIIETNRENIPPASVDAYLATGVLQKFADSVEKLDVVSENLQYFGKSYQGALETSPVWEIQKTAKVDTVTTRETFHDVAWSDRANL